MAIGIKNIDGNIVFVGRNKALYLESTGFSFF